MEKDSLLYQIISAKPPVKKADLPAQKEKNLPVNVKRDLIKKLYGSIGEQMFGFTPDRVRWMHSAIDQMMSDGDVEKEWEFIRKGNVQKLLMLMQQMQGAGPEDAAELEEMENLWNSIAQGIIKTKQANKEIDQKTWDFVENELMTFVDKFSEKLSKKADKQIDQKKKLLSSNLLTAMDHEAVMDEYEINYKGYTISIESYDGKEWFGLIWDPNGKRKDTANNCKSAKQAESIAKSIVDDYEVSLASVLASAHESVLVTVLSKRVKSATQEDVVELEALHASIFAMSRKLHKILPQLRKYVNVSKIEGLPVELALFSGKLLNTKKNIEQELASPIKEEKKGE